MAERSESALGVLCARLPADSAEIFRHEIKYPLTGILANAWETQPPSLKPA